MSKLIDWLDECVLKAEEMGTNFESDEVWDDAAHEVLTSYNKLRAVVLAAKKLSDNSNFILLDSYGEQLIGKLDKTLAALEEDV